MRRPLNIPPTVAILVILLWIELLVGLALFHSPSSPANLTREEGDLRAISSALKAYKMNAGHYPSTEQGLEALVNRPEDPPHPKRWTKLMDSVPHDPWNNIYRYRALPEDDKRGFEIISMGRDGQLETEDDLSSLDD
jgi:general secretion pathway protein G